jgi:hypothetical protein
MSGKVFISWPSLVYPQSTVGESDSTAVEMMFEWLGWKERQARPDRLGLFE